MADNNQQRGQRDGGGRRGKNRHQQNQRPHRPAFGLVGNPQFMAQAGGTGIVILYVLKLSQGNQVFSGERIRLWINGLIQSAPDGGSMFTMDEFGLLTGSFVESNPRTNPTMTISAQMVGQPAVTFGESIKLHDIDLLPWNPRIQVLEETKRRATLDADAEEQRLRADKAARERTNLIPKADGAAAAKKAAEIAEAKSKRAENDVKSAEFRIAKRTLLADYAKPLPFSLEVTDVGWRHDKNGVTHSYFVIRVFGKDTRELDVQLSLVGPLPFCEQPIDTATELPATWGEKKQRHDLQLSSNSLYCFEIINDHFERLNIDAHVQGVDLEGDNIIRVPGACAVQVKKIAIRPPANDCFRSLKLFFAGMRGEW